MVNRETIHADLTSEQTGLVRHAADGIITTDKRGLPRGEDAASAVHHASTPPIAVAHPTSAMEVIHTPAMNINGRGPHLQGDQSLWQSHVATKSSSITFRPTVTLDTGSQRARNQPLPNLPAHSAARPDFLYQESKGPSRWALSRIQSEADTRNYDPITGRAVDPPSRNQSPVQKNTTGTQFAPPAQATDIVDSRTRTSSDSEQGSDDGQENSYESSTRGRHSARDAGERSSEGK